jgi:mRNA-degrading endonuclease RelE of RelBE toxin-antitoxin system
MQGRFTIFFSEGVKDDLEDLRAYDRSLIFDAIERQLTDSPHAETKQRKLLRNLVPPFEAVPPIWQLRVGPFRVFYDVNEQERRVYVRTIRRKPAHRKTEEIL